MVGTQLTCIQLTSLQVLSAAIGAKQDLKGICHFLGIFILLKKSKLRVLHPEQALINVKTGSGRKMGSFYERRFLRSWPQLFRVSWNMDTKCLNIIAQ